MRGFISRSGEYNNLRQFMAGKKQGGTLQLLTYSANDEFKLSSN